MDVSGVNGPCQNKKSESLRIIKGTLCSPEFDLQKEGNGYEWRHILNIYIYIALIIFDPWTLDTDPFRRSLFR